MTDVLLIIILGVLVIIGWLIFCLCNRLLLLTLDINDFGQAAHMQELKMREEVGLISDKVGLIRESVMDIDDNIKQHPSMSDRR